MRAKIGLLAKSAAAAAALCLAAPGGALAQLQDITITAQTPGATTGTFLGPSGGLTETGELSQTSGSRTYISAYFVAGASRSYYFGQTAATVDTVMILYTGVFNPASPSTGAVALNDDTTADDHLSRAGATVVGCADTRWCPQVSYTLASGQVVTLVVTTYSAGDPLGFPITVYADGPGTFTSAPPQLGPDVDNTVISILLNEPAVRSLLLRHATATTNALEYDCAVFDSNNVCVSVGARYGQLGSDNNEFTGLLTAAYRATDEIRVGAFADYRFAGTTPDGLRLRNNTPIFGGFVVYEENRDTSGLRLRASIAYQEAQLRVTRSELTNTEPGQGTGTLGSLGFGAEASYGFRDTNGWVFAPYAGLRRIETSRGRYTETTSDAVEFPLSYDRFGQYVTSGITGVRVRGPLADGLTFVAGAGIEYDLNSRLNAYSGTSTVPGLVSFSVTTDEDARRLRAVGSVGLRYDVAANQQLMLDAGVRETPYSDKPNITTMVRYAMGF